MCYGLGSGMCVTLVKYYVLSESTEKLPLEVGFSHPHHFRPKNVCSLQSGDRLAL